MVPAYAIALDEGDYKWLTGHVGTERLFQGELHCGDERRPVWIGYRGRYSRWFRKPSYDIWLPPDQPLGGNTRLHLNAAYRDPSLLRGRLALALFADIGVPTPQAWHVSLAINGQDRGLYTAIESFDDRWLSRRGMAGSTVYYAAGRGGNLHVTDYKTGRRKRYIAMGFEKSQPWDDDFSDLEALIRLASTPDDAAFAEQIEQELDVDNFLRWLIGLEYLSHTDGFVQNYALFRPPGGRWRISPWDCDGTMGRIPNGRTYHALELDVATGDDNHLAARLLEVPRWQQHYLHLWDELMNGPLAAARVLQDLDALYREIGPAARADQHKRRSNTTFRRERIRIRNYLQERCLYVQAILRKRRRTWGLETKKVRQVT